MLVFEPGDRVKQFRAEGTALPKNNGRAGVVRRPGQGSRVEVLFDGDEKGRRVPPTCLVHVQVRGE